MRTPLLSLVALLALGVSGPGWAQEPEAPPMLWVLQDYVAPSNVQAYEVAAKELVDLLGSVNAEPGYTTISGPEIGYAYVMPVNGFAGIGEVWQQWDATVEAIGAERFAEVHAQFGETIDHTASSVIMLRPDLSYRLDDTALSPEKPFRMYHWLYTVPGKEQDMERVAKAYVELYESKGIEHGWRTYQVVMGPDLPAYLIAESADSEADYWAAMSELQEVLGEEGEALSQEGMKYMRRIEINSGWVRADLSYPQPDCRLSSV